MSVLDMIPRSKIVKSLIEIKIYKESQQQILAGRRNDHRTQR